MSILEEYGAFKLNPVYLSQLLLFVLKIYDSGILLRAFCSHEEAKNIQSISSLVRVHFQSDEFFGLAGFNISFSFTKGTLVSCSLSTYRYYSKC